MESTSNKRSLSLVIILIIILTGLVVAILEFNKNYTIVRNNYEQSSKPIPPVVDSKKIQISDLPDEVKMTLEAKFGTGKIFSIILSTADQGTFLLKNPKLKDARELQFPITTNQIIDIKPVSIVDFKGSDCQAYSF